MKLPTDETCTVCRAPECAVTDQYFRRGGIVMRRIVCEDCLDASSEETIAFDQEFRRQRAATAPRAKAA